MFWLLFRYLHKEISEQFKGRIEMSKEDRKITNVESHRLYFLPQRRYQRVIPGAVIFTIGALILPLSPLAAVIIMILGIVVAFFGWNWAQDALIFEDARISYFNKRNLRVSRYWRIAYILKIEMFLKTADDSTYHLALPSFTEISDEQGFARKQDGALDIESVLENPSVIKNLELAFVFRKDYEPLHISFKNFFEEGEEQLEAAQKVIHFLRPILWATQSYERTVSKKTADSIEPSKEEV